MREENKLNKAIKQDGIDTQSEILEELKRRYPQYVEQSDKKQARKRKFAFISAIAVAAVCVAIIVPCAVLLPNRNNGSNSGDGTNRYCTQDEYKKDDVDFTIVEYRASHDLNFLYFDWYEFGEDISTVCYISKSDKEVLGLEEQAYLPKLNAVVQLSITQANVYLSEFDATITNCIREYAVEKHMVKWDINDSVATCVFEDKGYRYFIQVMPTSDENRLFELVAELLETK